MAKDAGLILLCPSLSCCAMQARLGVAAELADDERLLISNMPVGQVSILGRLFVPANVFVHPDHIESFTQWIINILFMPLRANQQCCCDKPRLDQAAWTSAASSLEEGSRSLGSEWCFVGNRPKA